MMDDGSMCDGALAEIDVIRREYVSLELVSIPRSIMVSTNRMFSKAKRHIELC